MAIRLSGLTSGLDTDAIVQELVSAYSLKTQKYEKASTKLTWKQDIWKTLNTKVYGLYTNVSNMRYSSAYSLRKVSVSDNTKATVTATGSAVTGNHTLNVKQTAQSCYMTGGYLGEKVTEDTKLSELGYGVGDSTSGTGSTDKDQKGSFKVKFADGTTKEIDVTKDTTIKELVNKLKATGLNASFDANNHRIFVNAKKSGNENDFVFLSNTDRGFDALSCLKLDVSLVEEDPKVKDKYHFTQAAEEYKNAYDNYYKSFDEEWKVEGEPKKDSIYDYVRYFYENVYKQKYNTNIEYQNVVNELKNTQSAIETEIGIYTKKLNAIDAFNRIKGEVNPIKNLSNKDFDEMLKMFDDNSNVDAVAAEFVKKYKENHKDDEPPTELSLEDAKSIADIFTKNADDLRSYVQYANRYDSFAGYKIELDKIDDIISDEGEKKKTEEKIKKFQKDYAAAETSITENNAKIEKLKPFFEQYQDLAKVKAIEDEKLEKENPTAEEIEEFNKQKAIKVDNELMEIGQLAEKSAQILSNGKNYSNGQATMIAGCDAEIELNGVTYTGSSNNFVINGLSITALAKGETTITTTIDTQGIYDKVKDFLTEYNTIINEMTKLYNADSAGDYEPLTDEEKEAMSDEQIEKWETKIKDSLLRRDTTLNSIMSGMINAMAQTFEINGKTMSLTTFGIHTLGYLNAPKNEQYAMHIDGDEDDENTSGKEEKLMAAIMENPEEVEEFMKKLSENLYKTIDDKMKSTELSSAYKVYNDKEMDKELLKYEQAISKWEEKVKDKEDYYYKQFSNMETALSKLQSQTSSISSLLGS